MPFYDAGDAAIHYETYGDDGPPLALLHGYALNGLMWDLQIESFAEKYRTVTVDLRGFGQSSCGRRWSGSVMAEDIQGLIEFLDLRNAAILGFSMSGPVAFRAALAMPERIERLIMVSSILPSRGTPKVSQEEKSQYRELETLRLYGVEEWASATGMWDGPLIRNTFKRNPQCRSVWQDMLAAHNPDYLLGMMRARGATPSNVDWRSRLTEIQQPSLIVAGADDRKFIDASHYLARTIPNAELAIIEGAGHMVNLEKPDEFNQAVLDFLNRH